MSAQDGWVLGTADCLSGPGRCTAVLRTQDGGKSWSGIPAPLATASGNGPELNSVSRVRFANQLDGWVYGDQLWATHDGGATWRQQSLGSTALEVASLETSGGSVWAVADDCATQPASCGDGATVYRSPIDDDGWQAVGPALLGQPPSLGAPPILAVDGQSWWLAFGSAAYHGQGSGPASELASVCTASYTGIVAITAAGATHLDVLCEGQGATGSASEQLYGTVDGGQSWSASGPATVGADDVGGIADNGQGVLLLARSGGASRSGPRNPRGRGALCQPRCRPELGSGRVRLTRG